MVRRFTGFALEVLQSLPKQRWWPQRAANIILILLN
jgi:hypothetical protein